MNPRLSLRWAPFVLIPVFAGLSGCSTAGGTPLGPRPKPAAAPVNFVGVDRLPESVRRVVVLPVSGGDEQLDGVVIEALQRQNRFEVVALDRSDCLRRYRREEFPSTGMLPNGFLESLRRETAADAVLFIDVTTARSYRPLILGLRAKLAAVEEVRLLWSFDHVFSAANPGVAKDAMVHFRYGEGASELADRSAAVLQSPSRFAAYAADAAFATLPPR